MDSVLQTTNAIELSSPQYRAMYKSQEDIIKDCVKKKRKAQKLLYEHYHRPMLGICLRYCSTNTEAEDVMMTGFMNVFTKIASYKGSGSFEAWMKKVMINTAIDNFRKNKKYKDHLDISEFEDELSTENIIAENISQKEVLNLLRELPPGYRMVFNLYAIEGYSHPEIAAMLGVSVNTSKTQLFKARKMLQDAIQKLNRDFNTTENNG